MKNRTNPPEHRLPHALALEKTTFRIHRTWQPDRPLTRVFAAHIQRRREGR